MFASVLTAVVVGLLECTAGDTKDCAAKGLSCCSDGGPFAGGYRCFNTTLEQCCHVQPSDDPPRNDLCNKTTQHCAMHSTKGGCLPTPYVTCTATSPGNCQAGQACCIAKAAPEDMPACFWPHNETCCESSGPAASPTHLSAWHKIDLCNNSAQHCDAACGCMGNTPSEVCCPNVHGSPLVGNIQTLSHCSASKKCSETCGCMPEGAACCPWPSAAAFKNQKQAKCDVATEDCTECGCHKKADTSTVCCDKTATFCPAVQLCDTCGCRDADEFCCKNTVCKSGLETCGDACGCMPAAGNHTCCHSTPVADNPKHQTCDMDTHQCDAHCGCIPKDFACCMPDGTEDSPKPYNTTTEHCCRTQYAPSWLCKTAEKCCHFFNTEFWCCPDTAASCGGDNTTPRCPAHP